jgi:hypothetical protein
LKKIFIITLLLSIATVSVFADRMILIQATYLQTNRIIEDGSDEEKHNFGEYGITFTSFVGKDLGFYSSATFLLPFKMNKSINDVDNGDFIDIYDDFSLGLDALLGVGFLAPINRSFSLLAAGGLHFNGVALTSSSHLVDPYLKYNLGPGIALNGLFHLTRSLNLNISALGAWDMFEFVTMPDPASGETVKGGITWSISAGLGFAY